MPAPAKTVPSGDNGNVMKLQIANLQTDVSELMRFKERILTDHISREDFNDLKEQLNSIDKQLGQLKERLTIFQLAQGVFTGIVGTIATILGSLK